MVGVLWKMIEGKKKHDSTKAVGILYSFRRTLACVAEYRN